jgi:hypothetical protein
MFIRSDRNMLQVVVYIFLVKSRVINQLEIINMNLLILIFEWVEIQVI